MKSKKIVILCGSPRPKGNTHTLAEWVAEGARGEGPEVEKVDVTKLRYAAYGCISCYGCQRSREYRCVLKDEASELLARLPEADALVIATPIYFFGPSAQTKVFLDRGFSLAKFAADGTAATAFKKGTAIALVASAGGGPDDGLAATEATYRKFADFTGGKFSSILVPHAPPAEGALARDPAARDKALAFGEELARSL